MRTLKDLWKSSEKLAAKTASKVETKGLVQRLPKTPVAGGSFRTARDADGDREHALIEDLSWHAWEHGLVDKN